MHKEFLAKGRRELYHMGSMITPKHIVAVIDYGSQYTQLIVRRVRELGYMAGLYTPEEIDEITEPGAVILSGGPKSTYDPDAPESSDEYGSFADAL